VKKPHEKDIVLLCNPQAGGRWKELAEILDSEGARDVRRIVTDAIDDISPALAEMGGKTRLLCIYGGDGTIQRILDRLYPARGETDLQLAFIGGGTMNIAARWCGFTSSPGKNFRHVIRSYKSGQLLLKEVPLLEVRQGERVNRGFTFGIGPPARVLNEYENSSKGKTAALAVVAKSVLGVWGGIHTDYDRILRELDAEIIVDGAPLPYRRFVAVFCNVTGSLNLGVQPFVKARSRDDFYYAAFATTPKEFVALLPLLIRGRLPMDPKSLLKPISTWGRVAMAMVGRETFPTDPRYVNSTAKRFEIRCAESLYTVDGEILQSDGSPITVTLGTVLKLVVNSTVDLGATLRLAASVVDGKKR
jgi:diacylglycerol kinase family enzyme